MSKQLDVEQLLHNLSDLRFYSGDENSFYDDYLLNIATLCKSPLAVLISNDKINWNVEKEYCDKNIAQDIKNNILKQSIECSTRSIEKIYAYEKYQNSQYIVSIAQEHLDEEKDYVLVVLIENMNKNEFSNMILRVALCRDIILNYQISKLEKDNQDKNSQKALANTKNNIEVNNHDIQENNIFINFEQVLQLLNRIIYEKNFKVASMNIVDEYANRYNCNKVSLGWQINDYIKPIAINQVENFLSSSAIIKSLEAIFEESYEQDDEIFYPDDENTTLVTYSHKLYCTENRVANIYTFPIRIENMVVGVITFEKNEGELSTKELELIRLSLNYLAPTLEYIYKKDQSIFKKSISNIKEYSSNILGPKNTLKKLLVLLVTILLTWIVFGKLEYKVEAVANLQTDNISYISAPFDAIVKEVKIDAGDIVTKDQSLLLFDTQEFLLKKLEVNSDILRYDTEVEKARSNRSLADMKIAQAKKEQSIASLKKIDYFLDQANIKAPFDAIVIEGNKEKLQGSPFSKGDIILQLANPTELYAKIKILEEYIDEIKVGQIGKLNLLSRPDIYFDVKIEKIIPMANVDDVNGNVFIVKVVFLDEVKDWMRPGMSGITKITIEDRSVLWILTHKISDYFYMNIWW